VGLVSFVMRIYVYRSSDGKFTEAGHRRLMTTLNFEYLANPISCREDITRREAWSRLNYGIDRRASRETIGYILRKNGLFHLTAEPEIPRSERGRVGKWRM
jgi:outer membrane translocation and assembly module TamA